MLAKFRSLIKNLDKRYKVVIVAVLLVGILSHGMVLFNHFYFHDGTAALEGFSFGGRLTEGRWFLSILSFVEKIIYGSNIIILPLLVVVKTIALIVFVVCVLVKHLNINSLLLIFLLGGIWASFPSVASLFGYMHISYYYALGLLLGCIGVTLNFNSQSIGRFILSVILLTCSIGTYQAFFPIYLGLILCCMINMLIRKPNMTKKEILLKMTNALFMLILAIVAYFLINKIIVSVTDIVIPKAEYFTMSPKDYLSRIPFAVKMFFSGIGTHVMPFNSRWFYVVTIILLFIYGCNFVKKIYSTNKANGIILLLLFLLIPIVFNFIYIMCPANIVYSLMEYNFILPFFLLLCMVQNSFINNKIGKLLRYVSILTIFMVICSFIRIDNMCYAKAEINKQRTISYFTTLISEIKVMDGYCDKHKVLFVNPRSIEDASLEKKPFLHSIEVQPYRNMIDYLNDYDFNRYIYYWCGYAPQFVYEYDTLNYKEMIDDMPAYPSKGSIKLCGDTIIVKFGNKVIQ